MSRPSADSTCDGHHVSAQRKKFSSSRDPAVWVAPGSFCHGLSLSFLQKNFMVSNTNKVRTHADTEPGTTNSTVVAHEPRL